MTYRARAAIGEAIRANRGELVRRCGVVSTGIGYKVVGGEKTDQLSMVCGVERKLPLDVLKRSEVIPGDIGGIRTDVVQAGRIRVQRMASARDFVDKLRPAPGGVSVGHRDITAGTLGCWVHSGEDWMMLSNNHVLANSNMGKMGDPIYQPGPYDGGVDSDTIAHLHDFVPVEFTDGLPVDCPVSDWFVRFVNKAVGFFTSSRVRVKAFRQQEGVNLVDAAIARPVFDDVVAPEIMQIGEIKGIRGADLGDAVQKFGRTTEYTTGEIQQVDVTVNVQYGQGKIAVFEDQLIAGPMSAGGDSGSAVLDMDGNLVGLLFAGSEQLTVINRMENVFDALGLSL